MKIIVTPSDLIKRFIWDKYEYYCLDDKKQSEIVSIIEENLEFEITEQDAFVIGLTNVLYTGDIIHKFKQFLLDMLNNKSHEFDGRLYINKALFIQSVDTFKNKIPKTWNIDDAEFKYNYNRLQDMYDPFIESVENLLITHIQEFPCVKCGQVKKLINKLN